MKNILLPLFLFLFPLALPAQKLLIPVKDTVSGLFGYKKGGSKTWVIKPAFETASWLIDGSAIISRKGQYGLINESGKYIFPPWFDLLAGDSLLSFKKNDSSGIADRKGNIILNGQYTHLILAEEEGYAILIRDSLYGYWDKNGNLIDPFSRYELMFENGIAWFETDHTRGFISKKGEKIIEVNEGEIIELEGKGFVIRKVKESYYNSSGKFLAEFDQIIQVTDSIVLFKNNGRTGAMNLKGAMITAEEYEEIYPFNKNGLSVAIKKGRYGIINKEGRELLPCEYDYIESFIDRYKPLQLTYQEKKYVTIKNNGMIGVVNEIGSIVMPPYLLRAKTEEGLLWYIENDSLKIIDIEWEKNVLLNDVFKFVLNRAVVCMGENNDQCGLIDKHGKFFIPPSADRIRDLRNGFYLIRYKSGEGVIDSTGKILLQPVLKEIKILGDIHNAGKRDDFISDNYLYLISNSGKAGLADIKGKIVADTLWEDMHVFEDDCNCFSVRSKKGSWDLISARGKKSGSGFDEAPDFYGSYAVVKKKDKYGLINQKGKKIVKAKYDKLISQGNILFYFKDSLWGVLSSEGTELSLPLYNIISEYKGNFSLTRLGNHWGITDRQGKFFSGYSKLYSLQPFSKPSLENVHITFWSYPGLKDNDEVAFELVADSSSSFHSEVNKFILDNFSSDLKEMPSQKEPYSVKGISIEGKSSYKGKGIEIKGLTNYTVSIEFYFENHFDEKDEIEDSIKVYWYKNNSLQRVFMKDLFSDTNWVGYINEVIASKMREQGRMISSQGNNLFFDSANFVIDRKGLILDINPSAPILGMDFLQKEIMIGYDELDEIIDKNGPLGEFFH